MRIALVGQAAFAEKVMQGLLERGHSIAAFYCPPDAAAGKVDPAKARALELGIPVRQHRNLKGPEVQAEFEALDADLGVLAYVTQIVPPNVFSVPKLGSICFHPSLLPKYRGGSAVNWQLIRGETETGVSVFWVDPGIDTGPILLQRKAAVGPNDTAGSLYYDTLFPLGVTAVLDAVDLAGTPNPPREVQDESQATYDPLCRDEHAAIDWQRPIAEVFNQMRGCDPQPGAYVVHAGAKLRLYDARLAEGSGAAPGTVTRIADEGMEIAGNGGAVRVARLKGVGAKQAAAEYAAANGIVVGTRFESA